jgi:hypothetical protein
MRVAKILAGCTYGPETLKVICKAFDDAWASIAHHFAEEAHLANAARERLAHAILIAATEHSEDPEPIKNVALQIMTLSYRGSWLDPGAKFQAEEGVGASRS